MAGFDQKNENILKQSQLKLWKVEKKTTSFVDSELILTDDHLKWHWPYPKDSENKEGESHEDSVRLSWILKAEAAPIEDETAKTAKTAENAEGAEAAEGSGNEETSKLTIHYVQRLLPPEYRFSNTQVNFTGSKSICAEWVTIISEQLATKVPHRPKSLLVIVNPVSGNKKAEKIYKTKVAPLFDLVGIKVEVKTTKKAKDSYEIVENFDLTQVDGLLAVGGDGTYTEVLSALLHKTMKTAGLDEDDPACNIVPPEIRLGMIPAGSANGSPVFCNYSRDVLTSAIVIVLGESRTRDILTMHCGEKFLAYCSLLIGYGIMAQIMDTLEKNRWAGPARYLAAAFVGMIKHKSAEVEVHYLPEVEDTADSSEKLESEKGGEAIDELTDKPSNPADAKQAGPGETDDSAKVTAGSAENGTEAGESGTQSGATIGEGEPAKGGTADGELTGAAAPEVDQATASIPKLKPGWKSLSGKYLGIDAFAAKLEEVDFDRAYMTEHLVPSGVFSMMVMKPCGRLAHVKFMGQLQKGKLSKAVDDLEAVSLIHVREYKVMAVGDWRDSPQARAIDWDGDMLYAPEPHFEVRCHLNVLKNFARLDGEELRNIENEKLQKLEDEKAQKLENEKAQKAAHEKVQKSENEEAKKSENEQAQKSENEAEQKAENEPVQNPEDEQSQK